MRPAALLHVLGLLAAAGSCAGSTPPPAAATPGEGTPSGSAERAADSKATRPLTRDECQQLGQSITDTCHGTNTRSATIEGWCSDVIAGVSVGTWVSDCEKHITYVDAVCFAGTDSAKSMMDCDAAVSR
jgi:hypothetical protein